ncbi:Holliday junction resolvase RuvX [Candidatus Solincola tengchongensis]|uniref:Holliday junction resolvase RuvX n=1 Tax=Candidatus Solincola tengchongensis TaxID=2900693 RepID=UPI00257DC280|nr:Holliday junction resolvase RuvX [Candidatus Solincola tengchongensis]
MRSLGLDIGRRRIGVALSDPLGIYAFPLETLPGMSPEEICAYVEERAREGVGTVVLGYPRTLRGHEGSEARMVRDYAQALASLEGVRVVVWDERLSTVEAERRLREAGRLKRGKKVDAQAAAVILQSYLDAVRGKGEAETNG